MKSRFLIFALLTLCCGLGGCIYEELPECPSQEAVAVEVRIAPENPDCITRSTDENTISDINLLLFGPGGAHAIYSTTPHLRFECLPGAYTLYAFANAHMDMRNFTAEMLETFAVPDRPEFDDLVMTAVQQITIPARSEAVELPPLEVRRAVARVDYNIQVDESVADIEIRSVRAINLPVHYRPFVEGFRPSDFLDRELVAAAEDGSSVQGSFYMLPNCQGVRSSITAPGQKNPDNAPGNATCLHIRAVRGGKVLDYYVYLGENDTSDFNVRPNTVHTLRIRILGDNDLRLRQYALDVEMATRSVPQDGFMLEPLHGELRVRLTGSYDDMQVRGVLTLDEGDAACCTFDGRHPGAPLQYDLSSGALKCAAVYFPETFTRDNARLKFTLTVSDKYGEVGRYEFEYAFAYLFQVYRTWHNGPRVVCGHIESEDALAIVEHDTLSAVYDAVYCASEPAALRAVPDAGYRIDCWCTAPSHQGEVSFEETYRCDPLDGPTPLYLYFKPLVAPLEVSVRHDRTELTAYERSLAEIRINQPSYTGTYNVRIEGVPTFFQNLTADTDPVTEYTVDANGTHALRIRPERVGENPYTVTVTDEQGESRSFDASVRGVKTRALFSVDCRLTAEPRLTADVECTAPVPEELMLSVRPTVIFEAPSGLSTIRTYELNVRIRAGTTTGGDTLCIDPVPEASFSLLNTEVAFSQSALDNGMIEYVLAG